MKFFLLFVMTCLSACAKVDSTKVFDQQQARIVANQIAGNTAQNS